MDRRIVRWFAPPGFDDDEKTRRAMVFNTIAIAAMGVSLVLVAGNLAGGESPPIIYVIDLLVFFTALWQWFRIRSGNLFLVGESMLLSGFVYITVGVASLGTIRTPITAIYLFLIIIAEVVYGRKGALLSTVLSSLAVLGLVLAENAGWLPSPNYHITITQWITYTVLFASVGGLSNITYQFMKKALSEAQREIEERKRVEQALRESEARWQFALEGAGDGLWDWNARTNEVYYSGQWKAMLGYAPDEIRHVLAEWDERLHPDDRERVYAELNRHLQGQTDFYVTEHRLRCKDGSYKWMLDRGKVISHAPDGAPLRMIGTHTDITESKNAEMALRESENRFRSLFEQTHDAVFIIDLGGHHLAANQRAADMLGYSVEEILGLSVSEISAEMEQSQDVLEQLLAGKHVPAYERRFRKKDGQILTVEINVELVRDKNGAPWHIQSVVNDISQRKLAEAEAEKAALALKKLNEQLSLRVAEVESLQAELREQALRDPLTGLYNRRYLSETLDREIERAARENQPLSVLISDIDLFKMINDTYGHQVGDFFLVEIARRMKRFTRASDILCRYGGEEFLLVLPNTTCEAAVKRAEELRQICAQTILRSEGKDLGVTLSVGVATFPSHGQTGEEIIIHADKALYQSKHTGRNRVTVWPC